MNLALLLAATAATAVGAAALHAAHGLRRELTALRAELTGPDGAGAGPAAVPAARAVPAVETPLADIRAAVADALAEERERELAEARAFWAAQEARDAGEGPSLLGGPTAAYGEDSPLYIPRQPDLAGLEPFLDPELLESVDAADSADETADSPAPAESPELAAARRRHPSHPSNHPDPGARAGGVAGEEETLARLAELADTGIPLADVRPGPLGTLDVYVFADGTTICMTPGHRETAERLARSLDDGDAPVLLGGSSVSGAYALTFGCGEESVYILADRVIASL